MKKETNKTKKIDIKKIIVLIILIVIIFLLIDFIFTSNKLTKTTNNNQLSEFEKIALYDYIQNQFLDYNVLHKLDSSNEYSTYQEYGKLEYAIAYFMKNNNAQKATVGDIRDAYNKVFGENIDLQNNISTIDYEFNNEKQQYEKRKDIPNNETNYMMKIIEITQNNNDENIVKIDILEPKDINEFVNYYMYNPERIEKNREIVNKLEELRIRNMKNQTIEHNDFETNKYLNSIINDENKNELTEKIATAELKLKVQDGRYLITDYTQQVQE